MRTSSSTTASARCPRIDSGRLEREVDRILGKPFAWLARGPDEFYCMGACLHLIELSAGVRIEDPFAHPYVGGLRGFWRRFQEIDLQDRLEPLDILFWRWGPGQPHVVLVENGRWVVSVKRGEGVCRVPLHEARRRAESAYRLKELV